jgi:DNA-binding CsgD family transcriptional regulator
MRTRVRTGRIRAPLEEVAMRHPPAALTIDAANRIVMANEQSLEVLRRYAGDSKEHKKFDELPPRLKELAVQLRRDLGERADVLFAAPVAADLCVRGCLMDSPEGSYLLLFFERPRRRTPDLPNLRHYELTRREQEVATLVLQGLSNRSIADRLTLTTYTVQGYLKSIFAKTGVHNRAALVSSILGWTGAPQP